MPAEYIAERVAEARRIVAQPGAHSETAIRLAWCWLSGRPPFVCIRGGRS